MAPRVLLKRKQEPKRTHDPDEDFKIAHTIRNKAGLVSVALKHPNGIIMQLFDFHEQTEPILGGGYRTFKVSRAREGARWVLNGNTFPFGRPPRHLIIGGYGITPGIPEDAWNEWREANADSELVRNHLIFAYKSGDRLADDARDHEGTRSGLEPIDPDNLPKGFQREAKNKNITFGKADLSE